MVGTADPEHLYAALNIAAGLHLPTDRVAGLAAALTAGWTVRDLLDKLRDDWPPVCDPIKIMTYRLNTLPPPPRPVQRDPRLTDRPARRERLRPDPGWCGACGESTRRLLHRELARMVDCPSCSPYVAGAAA